MMTHRLPWFLLCGLMLVAAGGARAASDDPAADEARSAIAQRLAADEAACYQKFAVNDCLRRARQRSRGALEEWARRDHAAKERERRERSAMHQQELRDKREAADSRAPQISGQGGHSLRRSQQTPASPRVRVDDALAERAAQQRTRDAQAAKAHRRLLEKQAAAAERGQARARRQAQREAKGGPPAAPLPAPQ